jgi:hypothetical protein
MSRAVAWSLAALVLLGCETGEVPQRGAQAEPPRQFQPPEKSERPRVDAPRPEAATVDAPVPDEESEPEARDLNNELNAALGVPTDCVRDYDASRPTTIRVSVSASVRPSGRVITPRVYGYGLSAAARSCIEDKVSRIVLPKLDQSVSEAVSTVVEIDYEPPVVVVSAPGTPEPELRNVREPLPKRPEVAPSGRPIQEPTSKWISGGFEGGRPIQEPKNSRKIQGPKPRAIDGYEVDENAQDWRQ